MYLDDSLLECDDHLFEYAYTFVRSAYLCFKVRVGVRAYVDIVKSGMAVNMPIRPRKMLARGKLEILMDRKAALPTAICMLYMTY